MRAWRLCAAVVALGCGDGSGAPDECGFAIAHATSDAIGTVEIVTFSVDLPELTEAHVDFGPAGAAPTMRAPVDLHEPSHRTLLLGMKGAKPYRFRVVATGGGTTCTSNDRTFTTGAVPADVPKVMRTTATAGASQGFVVTSGGLDIGSSLPPAVIVFDTDGDVVWWSPSPPSTTRAHMSWDGKTMWMLALNLSDAGGAMWSASMDGLAFRDDVPGFAHAHHDFAVLPDGSLAAMVWNAGHGEERPNALVEVSPDGTTTTVVPDLVALYQSESFHPNALHYLPDDDSYTLSDVDVSAFVKVKRTGALAWQLGGANPQGRSFTLVGLEPWAGNHGHHLTPDGHFLFFTNGPPAKPMSAVIELALDETGQTATKTWQYQNGMNSSILGDAQRLPNGNVLVTFSHVGLMQEITPSGTVVQEFKSLILSFGYADFRPSLYGPPPR